MQKQGSTAWVQATASMKLEAGDYLQTGDNGTAVLLFFEGSTMEVQPDTEILINELSLAGTGSTTIGLKQLVGSTVNRVQKLVDSESKYEVDTPAASAAVRGTIFKLLVEIDGNTTLNSEDGDVWFTANGVTVLVGTGMQSFACVGCPPSNPSPSVTPTPIPTPTSTPLPTPTPTPIVTPTPTAPQYYYAPPPTPTPEGGAPQVQITSPQDGYTTDNRLLTVSGNVTSTNEINTETGATITLNGEARSLPLTTEGNSTYNYYSFGTQVELIPGSNTITVTATDINGQTGNDTVVVNANIQSYAIEAELTWDTNGTDLDGHLIAPGYAMWDSFGDCYFGNMNPDWDGSGGNSTGDPSLDQDVRTGYGPEYIVLVFPPFNGVYQYKVHYWDDYGHGPSTATVGIQINGVLVFQGNRTMSNDEVWDCVSIDWPSGNVIAEHYSTHTLTVTSQGCCPILVEGMPCGNRTVDSGGNVTFVLREGTKVTLTAQTAEDCSFDYWQVDGNESTEQNPITVTMDSDHEATAVCSSATIPTPTPSLTNLTVVSQGCCPILVEGLPTGNQTVPAGGNSTFSEIPANTQVTLTAQTGESCSLDHWQVDGGNSTGENPLTVTMNSDHEATATCGPTYTLTVYSQGCCPILVSGLAVGNQTVPAGGNSTFSEIPANTQVTLSVDSGQQCYVESWWLDDNFYQEGGSLGVTMDVDHTVTAYCGQT